MGKSVFARISLKCEQGCEGMIASKYVGFAPPRNRRLDRAFNVAADSQRGYGIPGTDSTRRESYQKLGTAAVCCDPSAPFVDGAKYDGLDIAEPSGDNGQLRTHSNDDF
jgi:hypothetical protein